MNIPNPNPPDDETGLAFQARADVNAFAELYHRHVTRVYRYHMAHTGNPSDAEDLTSQTFMAALTGENLAALQAYQNQPVNVWGMIEMQDGRPVLQVERYEVPFPTCNSKSCTAHSKASRWKGRRLPSSPPQTARPTSRCRPTAFGWTVRRWEA